GRRGRSTRARRPVGARHSPCPGGEGSLRCGASLPVPTHVATPFSRLNTTLKSGVFTVQAYFTLAWQALRFAFARPFYAGDLVQQMDVIGVQSLGIVLLTGLFTGMVLALQSSVQLEAFGATQYIGRL